MKEKWWLMNDRCEDIPPPDGHGREKFCTCERKVGHKGLHGSGGYGKWDSHRQRWRNGKIIRP